MQALLALSRASLDGVVPKAESLHIAILMGNFVNFHCVLETQIVF